MMSKVQTMRAFVNQRLTAAAEEIFGLFERTIAEYEQEMVRQSRLLRDQPAVFPEFTVIKEDPPEQQQQWSPSLDQDPKKPQIKEEHEELWTSQSREQPRGPEEADTSFLLTSVPVKSEEDDEEEPQSSQLHHGQTEENRDAEHLKTEGDEEDCGGSEPAQSCNPDYLQPASSKTSLCSETEDSNGGLKQIRDHQSGLNALKNDDMGCNPAKKCFSCSECGKRFGNTDHLQIHMKCHSEGKTFTCPFCGKKFTKRSNLTTHLRVHTGEKPFTCSVCNTSFSLRCTLVNHMRVHTGEKPFICSVCSKRFSKKANLTTHMALHTEEKPFKCSICDKRFTWHSQVKNHKCVDSKR